MGAHPLLERLRREGFTLTRDGDKIMVAPRSRLTNELREAIRQRRAEILATLATTEAFAAAISSGALQQCQACRHFMKLIPADRDNLGVPDGGWCRRHNVATHPITPFWCDGYSPPKRGQI
jgi:TubC N-terminal docking domain